MIPFDTNTLTIKVFTALLLVSVLVFGGCRWQHGIDAGKIAKAEKHADTLRGSLKDAAKALGADSAAFRNLGEIAKATKADADRKQSLAQEQANQAKKDAHTFKARLETLSQQAQRDSKQCPAGEVIVCGSPLQ